MDQLHKGYKKFGRNMLKLLSFREAYKKGSSLETVKKYKIRAIMD